MRFESAWEANWCDCPPHRLVPRAGGGSKDVGELADWTRSGLGRPYSGPCFDASWRSITRSTRALARLNAFTSVAASFLCTIDEGSFASQ